MTWDQAKERITREAANYPEKKQLLEALVIGNKREHNLKGIMHELTQILDADKLFWPVRIGKVHAGGKPTGELKVLVTFKCRRKVNVR